MCKRILSVLLATLMLWCCCIAVSAEEAATTGAGDLFVIDEADLLTDSEEQALNEKLATISGAYNAQVTVATIVDTGDEYVDDLIESMYDRLGLGYGDGHDGILLLVAMDVREYRILSNGFAADAITLDAIDTIGSAIESDLTAENYVAAFDAYADKCDYYLNGYINGFPFAFWKNLAIALVIGLVVAWIVTGSMKGKLKTVRKQPAATAYTKPGSMQVFMSNDLFLYSTVSRRAKESKSSSSSSGSSRNVGGGSF